MLTGLYFVCPQVFEIYYQRDYMARLPAEIPAFFSCMMSDTSAARGTCANHSCAGLRSHLAPLPSHSTHGYLRVERLLRPLAVTFCAPSLRDNVNLPFSFAIALPLFDLCLLDSLLSTVLVVHLAPTLACH